MDERQAARERLEEARRTSSRRRAELEEAQKRVQQAAVFGAAAEVERAQEALERAQGAYDAAAIVEDELLIKHVEILHDEATRENPPRLTGRYFRERYTGERYKVTQLRGERLKVTEPVVEEFLDDQEAWEKEFKTSDRELQRQSEGVKRSKKDKREREAREKKAERERKKTAAAEKKAKKAEKPKAAKDKPKPKAAKDKPKPKPKPVATVPVKRGQTAVRATLYQLEPTKKVPEQEAGVVLRIRYKGRPVLVGLPVEHVKVGELVVHPELGELRSPKGGGLTAVVGPRYQVSLASDGVTLDGSWPYESAAVAAVQAANDKAGRVDWSKVRVIEGRVRWSSSEAEAKAKTWMTALQEAKPKAVVVTHQELVGTAPKTKSKAPKKSKAETPKPKPSAKAKAPKDKAPERAERPERLEDEDAEMMAEFRKLLAQPGVLDVVKAAAAGAEPERKRRQANPGAT